MVNDDKKWPFDQINDSNLRNNLNQIRIAAEQIWAPDAPKIIQDFTDHGILHSQRLLSYAEKLLKASNSVKLSDQETYLLSAGIYLHDIGMQCDVVMWPNIKQEAEGLGAKFEIQFTAKQANNYNVDEQKEIRKNHQYLSAAWIKYARQNDETVLSQAAKNIPLDLVKDLMDVCMYHTKLQIIDCPSTFAFDVTQRKRLVAAILRFSDELDIDGTRVSIETVRNFSIDPKNAIYWWMHNRTRINFSGPNVITITIVLNPKDFEMHGSLVDKMFIGEFLKKNQSIIEVLRENEIKIFFDRGSEVVSNEFVEPLPTEITDALREMIQPEKTIETKFDWQILYHTSGNLTSYLPVLLGQIEQFSSGNALEYLVVDLGKGRQWLTSRLYLFSRILSRLRGLRCIVFVSTSQDGPRFIGFAEPDQVSQAFGRRYPRLEQAFFDAYAENAKLEVFPAHGEITLQSARNIILGYVERVRNVQQILDREKSDYIELKDSNNNVYWEHAKWIDESGLNEALNESINTHSINKDELERGSDVERLKLILSKEGKFVAVTDNGGRFDSLIERQSLVERMMPLFIQSL